MTIDVEKPKRKPRAKKKPPTQTAGVTGIDGHGGMGEVPIEPYIDWQKIIALPAFGMFVFDESGASDHASMSNWVENRRASMGDDKLYQLYDKWHTAKGFWANETSDGKIKDTLL